mmetsp:Transcript_59124/g.93676  ORF Transcript_59124/g.93676 Transcript_59124/m.93676 type:complete len:85 (+) Transcript_59124:837-1091(+)
MFLGISPGKLRQTSTPLCACARLWAFFPLPAALAALATIKPDSRGVHSCQPWQGLSDTTLGVAAVTVLDGLGVLGGNSSASMAT